MNAERTDSGGSLRTRVKFCGITRPEDAVAAAVLGVDAIGFVFYPQSPRAVSLAAARAAALALPPFVAKVGLFVDATREFIAETLRAVPIDMLQFHGEETPEDCAGHDRPFIKAVRMQPGIDLAEVAFRYREAAALLVDSYRLDMYGGTGDVFDWALVPPGLTRPIILAGGLTPDNVATAIAAVRPYGVDVSGGIESAKGVKDHARMAAFMRGVLSVNHPSGGN